MAVYIFTVYSYNTMTDNIYSLVPTACKSLTYTNVTRFSSFDEVETEPGRSGRKVANYVTQSSYNGPSKSLYRYMKALISTEVDIDCCVLTAACRALIPRLEHIHYVTYY